jgi:uncharacterized membrane protein YkvA (DUF1232 family)
MRLLQNLEIEAKRVKRELLAVWYAYSDSRVKLVPKIIIGFAILYALSPVDLIPDFIPILGYLDDLILIPALIALAIRFIPKEVMVDARARAEKEPIQLGKNWTFAIIFLAIWLLVALGLINLGGRFF